MSSSALPQLFAIPLHYCPRLVQARQGTHGRDGRPQIERYLLPRLWCLHLYFYEARVQFGERVWELRPGCVTIVPPNTPLQYHYSRQSTHLYAHFSLDPSQTMDSGLQVRSWYDASEIGGEFRLTLERVIESFALAPNLPDLKRERAEVGLWELLWQLTEKTPQRAPVTPIHPSLAQALCLIEERLAEPLRATALAREVGLSHNQLTRLFVAHSGKTIVATIRHRRAERARYLLQHSTLSIGAIAAEVGVSGLGQFNHLMRRETGLSPRRLRHEGDGSLL